MRGIRLNQSETAAFWHPRLRDAFRFYDGACEKTRFGVETCGCLIGSRSQRFAVGYDRDGDVSLPTLALPASPVSATLVRDSTPRHQTHATRVRHLWRLHWGSWTLGCGSLLLRPRWPGCFVGKRVWFKRTWEPQVWDRHRDYCTTLQHQQPGGNLTIVCPSR
jgi:hypothetical protein